VVAVNEQFRRCFLRSSGIIVFLVLWELAPRLGWVDPYFVPTLSAVFFEIFDLFNAGTMLIHLLVSIWRAVVGLLTALVVGLPLGFLLARRYQTFAEAIDPILRVLSQVNPFTLMPVFMLFFGLGETAKVAVIAWVSVWPILFYSITAAREVDPIQIKTAASMGISPMDMLFKVIVPGALPTTFVGIRIAASITFYILVAAEMLGAGAGLGWLVHNAAMNYLIPRIYAGATFIVILGFMLNRSLIWLEQVLFVWKEEVFILPGKAATTGTPWRPGRYLATALVGLLLTVVIFGGYAVQMIDKQSAELGGGHSGHFGTPVDSGGSSY
jgi:NitT/TauT family transport system permease protein